MSAEKQLVKEPAKPVMTPFKYFHYISEGIAISVATLILAVVFIVNGFAGRNDYEVFGFRNNTGDISDIFFLQITPAGWTFAIWGVIYTWQAIWIGYGWTFVCRPAFTKTINPLVYVFYSIVNICNIIWSYLWGNALPQAAFPFIIIMVILNMCAIGVQVVQLYYQKPPIGEKYQKAFKIEYFLTQFIVVNGITIYTTWLCIATLLNLGIVIQYYGGLNAADSGTISLSLLTVELLVYFVLENVFLDRFLRYVFMVYPVVIWALSGAVSAHADDPERRNLIFTIVLLVVAIILFCVRIVLIIIFSFFRKIKKEFTTKEDTKTDTEVI